ncbi:hypothetical protein FQR65_LT08252 [Abscondita terminalis]|nr:hypothetical protein FQR65_LT08252 [Abscondita terminalis]
MSALHSRIVFYFLCVFAFYVTINSESVAKLPYCNDNIKQSELIFVSTLDGRFSALTPDGDLSWQIDTGPGSLLSSNIHKLELTNNGQWIRIIPSLSGSLYKFNGATIDPIPISADSLLTSSFRYLDDLAIAGGREVRTYGMMLNSGQQLYECSLHSCRNTTEYPDEMDNIIIVERRTHTVRALEPRTGVERWNFSVGQHNIKIPYLSCIDVNLKSTHINISAVLPEGLLVASKVEQLSEVIWQHKFETPIVAVWRWNGRELMPLNLFSSPGAMAPKSKTDVPSIYVGMHNKQLYVHESTSMQNILQNYQKTSDKDSVIESRSVTQIPWKPVPAVGMAINPVDEDDSTALSVLYASEYVNGNGYYLYTEEKAVCGNNMTNSTTSRKITTKLISWWKGAVIIAIITIIAGNIIAYKYKMFSSAELSQNLHTPTTPETEDILFNSRYIQEFEPITCLGKGGFGVVFQAKKKFDECDYAIKRIRLPNKPAAKERMMREVKALAKLDHRNIVRYYNAWLESPPHDWQKMHDEKWMGDYSLFVDNSASNLSLSNAQSSYAINVESYGYYEPNPDSLKRNLDSGEGSSIIFEESAEHTNSSASGNNNSRNKLNESKLNESNSLNLSSLPSPVYLYIQMQLCCKESLKDWLNAYPVRDKWQSLAIFGQIVDAVEYVHFRGLIHRDLKPSNIFFSLDGQIKVGDFGLVTSIEEYDEENDLFNLSSKKNHTNAVGTDLYMSPEQLNGQQYNCKVDIYSLGIIFFELLVPFKTEMERFKVLNDIRNRKYPKEFSTPSNKEFVLLDSMLSSDPQTRPSASGIREQLSLDETNKIEDPRFLN